MTDETTVDTTTADIDATPPTAGETQQESPATIERTFTQADLERILAERLAKAHAKADAQAAKVQAEAERKAAEEQGKYQQLYEQEKAKAAATEALLRDAQIASVRQSIAQKLGMPAALAARLRGDDEEAIEADAKDLMAALPKPAAPNINSAAGTNGSKLPAGFDEQNLRDQAVRLGVNPDIYLQQFMRS